MGIFKKVVSIASIIVLLTCNYAYGQSKKIPTGWPESISGPTGFADLGEKIKGEPGFPKNGTDMQKVNYVFSRLPDTVSAYDLKVGSSWRIDKSTIIGLDRLYRWARPSARDPEAADSLKGPFRIGNCGDWANAFAETLRGAGCGVGYVAYGDRFSGFTAPSFIGTATMVIVDERTPDGKISRRVFDPFNAIYYSPSGVATPQTLAEWGDLPLTDEDKLQRDIDAKRESWQSKTGKPYIKHGQTQTELQPVAPRFRPGPKPQVPERADVEKKIKKLAIIPSKVTIKEGETVTFQAQAEYEDDSKEDVSEKAGWSPWLPARQFKGEEIGDFEIHATYQGESATAMVSVEIWPMERGLNLVSTETIPSEGEVGKVFEFILRYNLEGVIPEKEIKVRHYFRLFKKEPKAKVTEDVRDEWITPTIDFKGNEVTFDYRFPKTAEPGAYIWEYSVQAEGFDKTLKGIGGEFWVKEEVEKRIVLDKAFIYPENGYPGDLFEFVLEYHLEGLQDKEEAKIRQHTEVTFGTEVVFRPEPKKLRVTDSDPWVTDIIRRKFWNDGKYSWTFTIGADGFAPLKVSRSFNVKPKFEAKPRPEVKPKPEKMPKPEEVAEKKITILSETVTPPVGTPRDTFTFHLKYILQGLSSEETPEVTQNIWVEGPIGADRRPVMRIPLKTQKQIARINTPLEVKPTGKLKKPGEYAWTYRLTAPGLEPAEGSVLFTVTPGPKLAEEREIPVAPGTAREGRPLEEETKPEYVYVLDYISYSGGAEPDFGMGGVTKIDKSLPSKDAPSGKVSSSQTSFAFGFAGKGGDWAGNNGPASVWGQLALSGLPARAKPGETFMVAATVSGGGGWNVKEGDYRGKYHSAWFTLNDQKKLTQTRSFIAPEKSKEWTPATFKAKGGAGYINSQIEITPHYSQFKSSEAPEWPQPSDLVEYPEEPTQISEPPSAPPEVRPPAVAPLTPTRRTDLERASEEERKRRGIPPSQRRVGAETAEEILSSAAPWKHPRVQQIIDSWLNIATPTLRQIGQAAWHYDEWGRVYNNTTVKKPTQPLETHQDRYEYLWGISPSLNSVSHLTLREYIERTLRGEIITPGPIPPSPLAPEPPPGTPTGSRIGQAAPVFETTDINGRPFNLIKERSNAVVLLFWARWDPSSRNISSSLQDLANQYSGERLRVVGISSGESPEMIKSFMAETGLNYTQVLDMQQRIAQLYNLQGYPQIFVIDPRGVIKFVGVGNVTNSADFQNAVREAVEESRRYRISEEPTAVMQPPSPREERELSKARARTGSGRLEFTFSDIPNKGPMTLDISYDQRTVSGKTDIFLLIKEATAPLVSLELEGSVEPASGKINAQAQGINTIGLGEKGDEVYVAVTAEYKGEFTGTISNDGNAQGTLFLTQKIVKIDGGIPESQADVGKTESMTLKWQGRFLSD